MPTPPPATAKPLASPLALEDTNRLFKRLNAGEWDAREQLVQRFMPLARSLAARYQRSSEPMDDLMQVASMGLLKAIDRFDPEYGTAFSTFAVPTILGELKRYFRDGWSIRVPRELQELVLKLEPTRQRLHRDLDRSPTVAEMAEALGTSQEKILDAMEASGASRMQSLDEAFGGNEEEGETRAERIGGEDPEFARAENSVTIDRLLSVLPEREQQVLRLRFFDDLSQTEIANQVGVSQMHVSRLIRRALTRLNTLASADMQRA